MVKKYRTIAETLEWGPVVTKVILETGKMPITAKVKPDEFTVNVQKQQTSTRTSSGRFSWVRSLTT